VKIIKTVATRCQILTLKCTKIDFGWRSPPDPAGGAYSPPQTPAGFKVAKGKGGEGKRGERRSTCLPARFDNPGYGHAREHSHGKPSPVASATG